MRDGDVGLDPLGQQAPELRVVPAQSLAAGVAMGADAGAKPPDLDTQLVEQDFIATVFPHPTLSEMMHESVLAAFGRVIHI